jgi:Zn-dependent membrane protease YugP
MATSLFTQKVRHALVPMRKSTMDAFFLGSFINLILLFTGVLFAYSWLIILIYALAYLFALVIRLRKAAYAASVALSQDPSLEEANETLVSEKTRIGLMLFWGNHPRI